ncbi:MAG: type II toxin-antitoxin system VapC family toxin [Deinococcales bacterium]
MRAILIDTDILSLFLRRHPKVNQHVSNYLDYYDQINFSIITYYEILSGLYHRDAKMQLESFLKLSQYSNIVELTKTSVNIAARIYADMRTQGTTLDDIDVLIAATAIDQNYVLASRNRRHFSRIQSLELVDWLDELV